MRTTTSRLALAVALAGGLAGGMVAPALADVDVTVTVTKEKTITVNETITITKDVTIDVTVDVELNGAAEAQALANMTNENNTITYSDDTQGRPIDFSASIDGSILTNFGVTHVNQDAGYDANQANLVAVGFVGSGEAFADAQAEADQLNRHNSFIEGSTTPHTLPPPLPTASPWMVIYRAGINNSINGPAPGVVGVNQNAGNNNNQLNAVAAAAGLDSAATTDVTGAMSEAALGQQNGGPTPGDGNSVLESGTYKVATITGSLSDNVGSVIGVNQASGNNANQANMVSLAAYVRP